jgi:histidine triad (HIT) family protein
MKKHYEKRNNMENCIFCKIVREEIPSKKVYEDADVFAFHDIHPAAPIHFMLVPKQHIDSLADVEDKHSSLLGKMMLLIPRLAKAEGCTDGFRTIINTGRVGGQEVYHLHVHIIGGTERLPVMIPHPK